ncbi:MAG: glycosyl hydrolase family 43 [Bacteroidales bacterium]|jgi:hypothetical protein|nr:glycosyl hydrolase [Bacteroidota bacterium]NLN99687.1 glycosyl hydrolase family 43 [Bacteroidales bacterium]
MILLSAVLALCAGFACTSPKIDLEANFKNPPQSAKPYTWWHWMNGNISKEGITADLEALAEAGVGGVQCFNISIMSRGSVDYGSDEWYELTNHAINEAKRLGLEFDMHNCPGWSSTGGKWITPDHAGKELTWTVTYVTGGKTIDRVLPKPNERLERYWDEAVVAYPSPKNDALVDKYLAKAFIDGRPVDPVSLSMNAKGEPMSFQRSIELEFTEPVTAQTFTGYLRNQPTAADTANLSQARQGFGGGPSGRAPTLRFSEDGVRYSDPKNVSVLPDAVSFASFPETTFKYVKIEAYAPAWVSGLQFSGAPMNDQFLRNANYAMSAGGGGGGFGRNPAPAPAKQISPEYLIDPTTVVNISEYMDAGGRLTWDAPEGDWTIVRLGYIPIDRYTKMGADAGTGLEADKYSREAIKSHWDNLFPKLIEGLEDVAHHIHAGLLIDSYEAGNCNWTPKMREDFKNLRGYDLTAYIPALIGKYVGSDNATQRFLWDFRRTCADLFADNYVGYMAELAHEHDILLYNEPYYSNIFDEMQVGSRADIPMGEFWVRTYQDRATLKMAASIAHVNGNRIDGNQIVGAEIFSGWSPDASYQNYPYSLKAQGDDAFTMGLNRYIFHRFAHQPNNYAKPGMSMGDIGFHFDRNNTWFEQGKDWLSYIARCQYLLQQGKIVSDALYLVSQAVPSSSHGQWNPDLPFGYSGDALNAEMLLNAVSVKGGKLVNSEGLRYSLLMLQNEPSKTMTIDVLRKIDEYVSAGGTVLGYAPVSTPNLSPEAELKEFASLVEKLWGGIEKGGDKAVGTGHVYATDDVQSVLDAIGIVPDVEYSFEEDAPVNFIHRNCGGTDIYFLGNHRRTAENLIVTFRVEGKRPELWDANTGEIIPVNVYDVLPDGRVRMELQFDPAGSWFVIFREKASSDHYTSVKLADEDVLRTTPFEPRRGGFYPNVHDNFTITMWVRPEANSSLPNIQGVRPSGISFGGSSARSTPFVLGNAEELYGKGHSVVGVAATRSGISVMERAGGMQPVCVASSVDKVASWNHVAVVYSGGVPALYVNGELKYTGEASGNIVHPTYKDVPISHNNSSVEGDFAGYTVVDRALTSAEIKAEFQKGEPFGIAPVEKVKYASSGLLFFENGEYTATKADGSAEIISISGIADPKDLTAAGWTVSFPENLGAPAQISMPRLEALHKNVDPDVKYFSGTATYTTTFSLAADELEGKKLFLDLGRVYVIARVTLNGKEAGVAWKAPFMLDITETAAAGENALKVEVANLWTNRLIGDAQTPDVYASVGGMRAGGSLPEWYLKGEPKPDDGKVAYSVVKFFEADEPLYDSGLVGPVVIRTAISR